MEVGRAWRRAGWGGLLMGTAILGERLEPRPLDLNHRSPWVAASPFPLLRAVPCVGLVALIFFFMGCVDQLE